MNRNKEGDALASLVILVILLVCWALYSWVIYPQTITPIGDVTITDRERSSHTDDDGNTTYRYEIEVAGDGVSLWLNVDRDTYRHCKVLAVIRGAQTGGIWDKDLAAFDAIEKRPTYRVVDGRPVVWRGE